MKLSVIPDGLQQSVKEYAAAKKEILSSLKVYSYPDSEDAFFVVFETNRSDGNFLFAKREIKEDKVYWQLTIPSGEQNAKFDH